MTATAMPPRAAMSTTLVQEWAFFRRQANPKIEAAALTVAVVARVAVGSWGSVDALVAAVVVAVQPLFEWIFHVYVLHYRPVSVLGRTIDFELARKHRDHHADPTDTELVFVPLRSLLKVIPIGAGAFVVLLPTLESALTAMATASALLLGYEWVHYLIHSRYRPKTRLFRAIWRAHRLHHYKNEQYWFGVTSPTADVVLRTYPDPSSVPTSPTARDLAAR